jgi:hypothetical protein
VSHEHRYWLGTETASDRHYAAIPVANGMIDYVKHYCIDDDQYQKFLEDQNAAIAFIEGCRRREHDDLLIQNPGNNRGIPV